MDLLRTLCESFGPSGFEDDIRSIIREKLTGLVDRIEEDALGNLTAWRDGKGDRVVMLDAHTDEVGILVSHVDDRGFVRFVPLGGWDARLFPGARVTLRGKDGFVSAAVGFPAPHITKPEERSKAIAAEDLFLDLGCHSKADAFDLGIGPGTPGVLDGPFKLLNEYLVLGKAFDDRAGCAVLVELVRGERFGFDLHAVFTVQEEVGLRGAQVAAYAIEPHCAFVLEGTIADDTPKDKDVSPTTELGKGPAITVMDRSFIADRRLVRLLTETAQELGIPYQFKQPGIGGTDAGAIHRAREGVPSVTVAVPCRYIHSPVTMLNLDDFNNTVRLMRESLSRLTRETLS